MARELTGGEEVHAALERTVAGGSARIEYRYRASVGDDVWSPGSRPARRRGGSRMGRLTRRLGSLFGRLLAGGMRRALRHWSAQIAAHSPTGVIDLDAHRCMYGPYKESGSRAEAVVVVGDRLWSGAPGSALDRLPGKPASALQPLWLLDLVRGVVDAREQTSEALDGHPCRRFAGHADLTRAAEVVSYELAIPSGIDRVDDLKQIPVEVWVDDEGYIRRIRHTSAGREAPLSTTATLDLTEFGTDLPPDWSRLPDR